MVVDRTPRYSVWLTRVNNILDPCLHLAWMLEYRVTMPRFHLSFKNAWQHLYWWIDLYPRPGPTASTAQRVDAAATGPSLYVFQARKSIRLLRRTMSAR